MSESSNDNKSEDAGKKSASSKVRANAQRNKDALLDAALALFSTKGVDVPVRAIAAQAGVGIGTLYRHFPQRADLIVAVFRRQVDACADEAAAFQAAYPADEALLRWLLRFADFIATKRGLAAALHSGDPAYSGLPAYFDKRFEPTLKALLDEAVKIGAVQVDIRPDELLRGVANLCVSADEGSDYTHRMVRLLVNGLRYATP